MRAPLGAGGTHMYHYLWCEGNCCRLLKPLHRSFREGSKVVKEFHDLALVTKVQKKLYYGQPVCTVLLPTHPAAHVYCTATNTSSSPCVLYCYQHIQQPTCTVLLPTHLAARVYCTATNTSSSPCVLYCYQHI